MFLKILLVVIGITLLRIGYLLGTRKRHKYQVPLPETIIAIIKDCCEKHRFFSVSHNFDFLKKITGKSRANLERAIFILVEQGKLTERLVDGVFCYHLNPEYREKLAEEQILREDERKKLFKKPNLSLVKERYPAPKYGKKLSFKSPSNPDKYFVGTVSPNATPFFFLSTVFRR